MSSLQFAEEKMKQILTVFVFWALGYFKKNLLIVSHKNGFHY